ncbi:MAG: hypothetical protein N2482_00535 [Patescibacteria group bacterium]|nr:hypothetical protein [Patescibacteria group bacterium]
MTEQEQPESQQQKTVRQAFKEIIAGYDLLNNLKFLVMALFGLFGFGKKRNN